MFNPERLTIARERRAMTKKGVAEKIGVSTNTVLRYESGEIEPTAENLVKLASALSFPEDFFLGGDVDMPLMSNASFRGLASKTEKVMKAALQSGTLSYILDDWVSDRYNRADVHLPEYPTEMDAQVAAKLLREEWKLGHKPIGNMVHLMESKGIRVFSLAENNKEVDAFSVWRDDIPYVFLNRFKSAERSRFDAAHELAHLCLHKHGGAAAEKKNSPIERDANAFAGAFLMPEEDVHAIVKGQIFSVEDLLPYKKRWRVAASALAYRLFELGIIPKSRSNSFYVDMSRRGWLKKEPEGISREQSSVWQQVFDDLRTRGISKFDISQDTGLPLKEIEDSVFGLANMISIDGTGYKTERKTTHLRIIK